MAQNYNFLKSFTFGGKQTKHLFQVAQVNIPFLSKDNEYFKIGNTNGQHFRNSALGDFSISVDGFIIKDNSGMSVSDTKDELVKIINSNEPQELVFDVLPDRYFMGIYSGAHEYDATDLNYTPLTLTFDVPDAFARSILIDGFTNTSVTSSNEFIDSEFTNLPKFFKSFVNKEEIGVSVDFTGGYPLDENPDTNYIYAQYSPNTRRDLPELKVGDKIGFTAEFMASELEEVTMIPPIEGEDLPPQGLGYVVSFRLDEYSLNPLKLLKTHMINIDYTDFVLGEWKKLANIITIENEKTKSLNITFGVRTQSKIHINKPMFVINPSVTDPQQLVYSPTVYGTASTLIKATNNGTGEAPISATFTMNSENALVGLLNATNGAVLQFGNPDDVDGIPKVRNEDVLNLGFDGKTAPTGFDYVNENFYSAYPHMYQQPTVLNLQNGSWDMAKDVNAVSPSYVTSPNNVWNGPSGVTNIPAPTSTNRKQDFNAFTRLNFDSNGVKNQRGRFEFAIMGEGMTSHYMSMIIRDSTISKEEMRVEAWLYGEQIWAISIDKTKVRRDYWEINLERRSNRLWFRIAEIKKQVNNSVTEVYKSYGFEYKLTEPDETNVISVGLWMPRYGNNPSIKVLNSANVRFIWRNSPYWSNVLNIFKQNDNVTIDVAQRKVFVNGVENLELNTLGNQWEDFYLPLGDTYLQPVASDFATMPDVTVNLQKRFL